MGLAAALGGCASAPSPSGASAELSGVRVETGSDATQVVLLGVADAQPTAVEEQNPSRIVVDLPDRRRGLRRGRHPGLGRHARGGHREPRRAPTADAHARRDRPRGRRHLGDADRAPTAWSCASRAARARRATAPAADGDAAADPWAASAPESASAESETRRAARCARTQLTGVSAKVEGDGVRGRPRRRTARSRARKSFMLESPPRLVVDLPGMKSAVTPSHVDGRSRHGEGGARRPARGQGARGGGRRPDGATSFAEKSAPHAGGLWLALAGAELPAMAEAHAGGGRRRERAERARRRRTSGRGRADGRRRAARPRRRPAAQRQGDDGARRPARLDGRPRPRGDRDRRAGRLHPDRGGREDADGAGARRPHPAGCGGAAHARAARRGLDGRGLRAARAGHARGARGRGACAGRQAGRHAARHDADARVRERRRGRRAGAGDRGGRRAMAAAGRGRAAATEAARRERRLGQGHEAGEAAASSPVRRRSTPTATASRCWKRAACSRARSTPAAASRSTSRTSRSTTCCG